VQAVRRPIRSLPVKALDQASDLARVLSDEAEIGVVPMTWKLAATWDRFVQPLVDGNFRRETDPTKDWPVRADVGWSWRSNWIWAALHSRYAATPGCQSGPCLAISIVLQLEGGDTFPVGMLTVIPRYHCNVYGEQRQRTFTWYLSDAPAELYDVHLNVDRVRGVASALLDTAVQAGLDAQLEGESLLHADPSGGTRLTEFYSRRCRMTQLPQDHPRVTLLRGHPPAEYFYWTAAAAQDFCVQFEERR
jgi:hypothetical protein